MYFTKISRTHILDPRALNRPQMRLKAIFRNISVPKKQLKTAKYPKIPNYLFSTSCVDVDKKYLKFFQTPENGLMCTFPSKISSLLKWSVLTCLGSSIDPPIIHIIFAVVYFNFVYKNRIYWSQIIQNKQQQK